MSNNLTIYDAEYWATRYRESLTDDSVFRRLAAEVDAKRGDSLLAKTVEHWKKLADQPIRPCGDKCTSHPCPCGHPERHCKGCSGDPGASPEDQPHSKRGGEGSIPSAPATSLGRFLRTWENSGDVDYITIRYKSGATITTDGRVSSYMPVDAGWNPKHVHETAASFDACSVCNPKQKLDHLPEGSH